MKMLLSSLKTQKCQLSFLHRGWGWNLKQLWWFVLYVVCVWRCRSCVYSNENTRETQCTQLCEPVPRYAHQFVYNHITKVCFTQNWCCLLSKLCKKNCLHSQVFIACLCQRNVGNIKYCLLSLWCISRVTSWLGQMQKNRLQRCQNCKIQKLHWLYRVRMHFRLRLLNEVRKFEVRFINSNSVFWHSLFDLS